jgi:anti-anti-sigma factor
VVLRPPKIFGFGDGLPEFERMIAGEVESDNCKIVIDFTDCKYLTSIAVAALVAAMKQCRGNGGDLRWGKVMPKACFPFDLNKYVQCYATVEEAVASFAGKSQGTTHS